MGRGEEDAGGLRPTVANWGAITNPRWVVWASRQRGEGSVAWVVGTCHFFTAHTHTERRTHTHSERQKCDGITKMPNLKDRSASSSAGSTRQVKFSLQAKSLFCSRWTRTSSRV